MRMFGSFGSESVDSINPWIQKFIFHLIQHFYKRLSLAVTLKDNDSEACIKSKLVW